MATFTGLKISEVPSASVEVVEDSGHPSSVRADDPTHDGCTACDDYYGTEAPDLMQRLIDSLPERHR